MKMPVLFSSTTRKVADKIKQPTKTFPLSVVPVFQSHICPFQARP